MSNLTFTKNINISQFKTSLNSMPTSRLKIREKFLLKTKKNFSSERKWDLPKINLTNPEVELVTNLSLNQKMNIFELITKDLKEREKIDNDEEVQNKILGVKKKVNYETLEEENKEIKNSQTREFFIKYEMMRREKEEEDKIEELRKYINLLENDREEMYRKITNLSKQKYDYDLEMKAIDFEKPNKNQEDYYIDDTKTLKSGVKGLRNSKKKAKKMDEFINNTLKIKEEKIKNEKKEKLEEKKKIVSEQLQIAEKDISFIEANYKEKKKELKDKIQILCETYHKKLYEGLDVRNDGLVWIIKAIWNLGENIQMSFFPKFLDNISIDYLFDIAHKSVQCDELLKLIDENKKKLDEKFQNLNKISNFKKNNNLFRTSIADKLKRKVLPREKLRELKKNIKDIPLDNMSIKEMAIFLNKKNIYSQLIEGPTMNTINDLKKRKEEIELEIVELKNKEMERIFKEYLYNNYEKKYHVDIEIIIGALIGESRKEKELLKFHRMEKDITDDMKKIQFYSMMEEYIKKKNQEEK